MARRQSRLPVHWIGVLKGWQRFKVNPIRALVSLPPEALRTHALVLGATGSGKTNFLHQLIAQDILLKHSFVVLDMRGDLAASVLKLCAGRVDPEQVLIFDLREKERPFGFNPLAGSGEPYFRALNVLDVLAREADSWGVQLGETVRNGLLLLAETKSPLTKFEAIFYDRSFRNDLLSDCRSENVIAFWQRYDNLSSDRQAALAMPAVNKLSLLLSTPSLRRMLGHPSPEDLQAHLNRKGSIILVSLAVDELHAAARMMGVLLLASICREVFSRVEIPEARRNPVRLYVDEFENFGEYDFESILAEGRRFGLSVVLANQVMAQQSTKMRSIIFGNVGSKIFFRTGREDSAILSKDLFGDVKAFDFPTLNRGECILWQQGFEPVEVEINEPLVSSTGGQSQEVRNFIRQIYARSQPVRDTPRQLTTQVARPPRTVETAPPEPTYRAPGPQEDWLASH